MKILVIYDRKMGNTENMAQSIAEGVKEASAEGMVKKIGARAFEKNEAV